MKKYYQISVGLVLILAVLFGCKNKKVPEEQPSAAVVALADSLRADSIAKAKQAAFEQHHPVSYSAEPGAFFQTFFSEGHTRPVGEYVVIQVPAGTEAKFNTASSDYQGKTMKAIVAVSYQSAVYDQNGDVLSVSGQERELFRFEIVDFAERQPYEKVNRMLKHSALTVRFQFPSGTFSNAMSSPFEFRLYDPEQHEYVYVTETQGRALVFQGDTIPVRFNGVLSYPRLPDHRFD